MNKSVISLLSNHWPLPDSPITNVEETKDINWPLPDGPSI